MHAEALSIADQPGQATGSVMSSSVPEPLEALFQEASQLVHATARRITGNGADAEDVLQSVFLHLMKTSPPAPWPDNPLAYVHRAAVNASLDIVRRRRRRPESELDPEAPPADPRDEEEAALSRLASRRAADQLADAMADLSPLEAEAFSLRYLEDMSNGEVARLMGKTPGHVRVTLHSARRKLRARLETPPHLSAPETCHD